MNESNSCVLVVDDNRINRLKLIRALSEENYGISEASGGREAIDSLQTQEIHLVLLDILMPDVDGYQVLEQMQSDQALRKIPVIMVSAVDEQDEVDRCLEMGAVDYITKPFDTEVLKDRVRSNLEKAS